MYLVSEMNDMINRGEIIQIKDRFRVPYSDNKNTISSCSLVLKQQEMVEKMEINQQKKKNRQDKSTPIKTIKVNKNHDAMYFSTIASEDVNPKINYIDNHLNKTKEIKK